MVADEFVMPQVEFVTADLGGRVLRKKWDAPENFTGLVAPIVTVMDMWITGKNFLLPPII